MKNNAYAGAIITIDGPAGAGKSTIAQALARALNLKYLDTGSLYRTLTLLALRERAGLHDEKTLSRMARDMDVRMEVSPKGEHLVFLGDEEITRAIRSIEVSGNVSQVASLKGVRKELVKKQRAMAHGGGIVVEGRDIGTVVFPKADLKFFVTASPHERAKRRYEEMKQEGLSVSARSIEQEMIRRDRMDTTRAANPLKKARDAILIDTTGRSISEVMDMLMGYVRQRLDGAVRAG
jgi:cytidylate kinase